MTNDHNAPRLRVKMWYVLLLLLAGSRVELLLQQADLVPRIAIAEAVNYYDSVESETPPPGKWKKK